MTRKLQNIAASEGAGAMSVLPESVRLDMLKNSKSRNHNKSELISGSMGSLSSLGNMTSMLNIDAVRKEPQSNFSETAQQIKKRKAAEKRANRSASK